MQTRKRTTDISMSMAVNTRSIFVQIFIIAICVTRITATGKQNEIAEVRLRNELFGGNRQYVRPVLNASQPTMVEVEMLYTQIISLNSKEQYLVSVVWMRQFWETPYLVWDPRDYEGLESLSVKPSEMWSPDLTVYNVADDKQEKSLFNAMDTNIVVSSDGKVIWLAPAVLKTDCKIAIDYFPFDIQSCNIKIASWVHDIRYINLRFKNENSTSGTLASYRENSEWKLESFERERNLESFSCCPAPFSTLIHTVKVRRRASYYVFNILLPCGIIALLSLASFGLPPDSGDRIPLIITILLAMSVYMTIIADKMPPNSDVIPSISIFFMVVMIQIALVLITTALIIRFHFSNGPLPSFVEFFINAELAKLVRLRRKRKNDCFLELQMKHFKVQDSLREEEIPEIEGNEIHNKAVNELNDDKLTTKKRHYSLKTRKEDDIYKHNVEEWQFASSVLNRLFFVVFLCSSLLSIFLILYNIFA